MELNPVMLTALGVVSGVLIVIVLVAIAIKVHSKRNRPGGAPGRGRRRSNHGGAPGSEASSGNKVPCNLAQRVAITWSFRKILCFNGTIFEEGMRIIYILTI